VAVIGLTGLNYFNVGSEKGVKINEVVQAVTDIVGHPLRIADLGERPGDVPASYATSERLRKMTDWRPRVGLEEGLRRTVDFYRGLKQRGST
jgi:nucleoside-diphosphate-sugar epimerase